MLLAEVVTVDDRDGHLVVGRDAGYNVTPEHFIYGEPTPSSLLGRPTSTPPRS